MVDIMNILAFFIERRVGKELTARTLGGRGPSVRGPMEESREEEGGGPAGDAATACGLGGCGCDVGRPGVGRAAPARPLGRPGTSLTLIACTGRIVAHLSRPRDPAEVKAGGRVVAFHG